MKMVLRCGIAGLTLAYAVQAEACQCPLFDEADMVRSEIEALPFSDVALDGFVAQTSSGPERITTIRANRIWFGTPQRDFRVKHVNLCSEHFTKGEKVGLALKRLPEDSGFWARLLSWFYPQPPLYQASGCSSFSSAMQYRKMREAVQKRAQR